MKGGGSLLDVGCSDGELVSRAWKSHSLVIGIDVDLRNLAKAKSRWESVEFQAANAEALPFRNESFDVVAMLDVLEHTSRKDLVLKEVERVLKPGGSLMISVPNKGAFAFLDVQKSILFSIGRKIAGRRSGAGDHPHYSLDEIVSAVGPSYQVVRTHRGGLILFPLCGYALMLTDAVGFMFLSEILRRIEETDFVKDYGDKSWHLMVELRKDWNQA
jgi:SAM-dependent methyltransferase